MDAVDQLLAQMEARKALAEIPFRSRLPLIGGLVAWLRTQVNRLSTQWYVRPLLQQQNELNALWLEAFREHVRASRHLIEQLDQDQMAMARQAAEFGYRLECLERSIRANASDETICASTGLGNTIDE